MTHDADTPRRRVADHGLLGRFIAWWREWGLLIVGVWLIAVSTGLLVIAVGFYRSQSATQAASRIACERSIEFGPPLADGFERERILPRRLIDKYRATIPTSCP